MNKSVIAVFALGILLLASAVSAQESSYIGIFYDADALECAGIIPLYISTPVNIIVSLTPDIPAITAAEFRIDGVNFTAADAIVSFAWASTLTIGDPLGDGFAIAFNLAQEGPLVFLGTMSLFSINPAWPGADVAWCIMETLDSFKLVVVDDVFETHDVTGWCFIANCTPGGPYGNCGCLDTIATEDTSWGAVKALY